MRISDWDSIRVLFRSQHNRHAAADDVTIAGFFGGEGVMFRAAQNMRAAGGKSELQPASDNLGGQAFPAVAGQSVDQQPPANDRRDQIGRSHQMAAERSEEHTLNSSH